MSTKKRPRDSRLYVGIFDAHCPKIHIPTRDACFDFISKNKIAGIVLGGDQLDNEAISHHNKGKISVEASGSVINDFKFCDRELLSPLERLAPKADKTWIDGNHSDWIYQYLEEHPQMKGAIEPDKALRLKERGWRYLRCGSIFKVGKLNWIHGETLTGRYHAQTAVDRYCSNVVYGHFHTVQTAIKILPQDANQRWGAWSMPAMCQLNPTYLRNKPTCWVNGFCLVEYFEGGLFNVNQIIVNKGKFSHGGRIYRG
jgi:hypothetical protein